MHFELSRYNIDKVKKALEGVSGKSVMINDTNLFGVVSIDISECKVHDDDIIRGDGGERDLIDITFNFENGRAAHSFCPDEEHCEIIFETDDLRIIQIEDMGKYIERKQFDLNFQLEEYNRHMSR